MALPINPKSDDIPSRMPAWVMPTLNFWVMYSAKKGKRSVPPMPSTKLTATTTQNRRGNSR